MKIVIAYTIDKYNIYELLNATCVLHGNLSIIDRLDSKGRPIKIWGFSSVGLVANDIRAASQILFRKNRVGKFDNFRLNKQVYNTLDFWDCKKYGLVGNYFIGSQEENVFEKRTFFSNSPDLFKEYKIKRR